MEGESGEKGGEFKRSEGVKGWRGIKCVCEYEYVRP